MSNTSKLTRRSSGFTSTPVNQRSASDSSTDNAAAFIVPLPTPVSPKSLSVDIPSLGSDEVLPPPKRGAPPVAPAATPAEKRRSFRQSLRLGKPMLDPALCEEWK
ncbi:hypothetical protein C8F04DRAFT_1183591 [Mycena alexandri]|uniref:Uncharacterized protein n=1 Tax=Mycena alexandri TaxID=1745969 RepID=A0AAD6X093_9AGAR|nr:hypothetical protein C8F04DRAFT_1183591 [Mycena alexandri]